MFPIEAPLESGEFSKIVETPPRTQYRAPDFTVVMRVRHHFGDGPAGDGELDVDSAAPFVGAVGHFPFSCPNVDPSEEALLQFEHRGSAQGLTFPEPQPDGGLQGITEEHPVSINGQALFGGIPATPTIGAMPLWSTRLLVIQPGILKDDNVLRIESTDSGSGRLDDFTVDNVVVFYKTRPAPLVKPPVESAYHVVHARETGNDQTGTGSNRHPYRTFQRAVHDVPVTLTPGTRWIIDLTGLGPENLPPGYVLPAWKCADVFDTVTDRFWVGYGGVNILATPQLVATLSPEDATVNEADIYSTVADTVAQLVTITLKTGRGSWAGNALKGKLVVGSLGGGENCVIWESGIKLPAGNADDNCAFIRITNTTLAPNTATDPSNAMHPTTPIQIMEPSAQLIGSSVGQFRGALNAINCDSISFNGLTITSTNGGAGLSAQGAGEVITQLCELESPNILTLGTFINRVQRSWIKGNPRLWGRFVVSQGLMDGCTNPLAGPSVPQFRRAVFDACHTLDVSDQLVQAGGQLPTTVSYFRMDNCLVRNTPVVAAASTGDGLCWHGSKGLLNRVDIYGCGRDGIRCELGTGILELQAVRTTGPANQGTGLRVLDGMSVKVDGTTTAPPPADASSKPITGATDLVVGLRTRTWADFLSGASGRPVKNEWDIISVGPNGATGSGSRVFQ